MSDSCQDSCQLDMRRLFFLNYPQANHNMIRFLSIPIRVDVQCSTHSCTLIFELWMIDVWNEMHVMKIHFDVGPMHIKNVLKWNASDSYRWKITFKSLQGCHSYDRKTGTPFNLSSLWIGMLEIFTNAPTYLSVLPENYKPVNDCIILYFNEHPNVQQDVTIRLQ